MSVIETIVITHHDNDDSFYFKALAKALIELRHELVIETLKDSIAELIKGLFAVSGKNPEHVLRYLEVWLNEEATQKLETAYGNSEFLVITNLNSWDQPSFYVM